MRFKEIIQLNERLHQLSGPMGIIERLKEFDSSWQGGEQAMKYLKQLEAQGQAQRIEQEPGIFSVVYSGTGGGPFVIKVSDFYGLTEWLSSFKSLDTFLRMGKERTNPLAPHILDYQIKDEAWFWVVMEKLTVKDKITTQKLIQQTFGTTWGYKEWGAPLTRLDLSDTIYNIQENIRSKLPHHIKKMRDDENSQRTDTQKKNFMNLIDFVEAIVNSGRVMWDVQPRNIGFRNNGELVIFDPIA